MQREIGRAYFVLEFMNTKIKINGHVYFSSYGSISTGDQAHTSGGRFLSEILPGVQINTPGVCGCRRGIMSPGFDILVSLLKLGILGNDDFSIGRAAFYIHKDNEEFSFVGPEMLASLTFTQN